MELTRRKIFCFLAGCVMGVAGVAGSTLQPKPGARAQVAASSKPIQALFVTGGLWHDYKKLVPSITKTLATHDNVHFQIETGLDVWRKPDFAAGYEVLVYDMCYDDVDAESMDNALAAGKKTPTIFVHCAVHSFRNSPKVHEWEEYIGLRSKVHDKFGPFEIVSVDPDSSLLKNIPGRWKTKGDELYQTIELLPGSHPLLQATSPVDGRTHTVAWTHTYGEARVFATTLGHDGKTEKMPEYRQLLENAVLWVAGR